MNRIFVRLFVFYYEKLITKTYLFLILFVFVISALYHYANVLLLSQLLSFSSSTFSVQSMMVEVSIYICTAFICLSVSFSLFPSPLSLLFLSFSLLYVIFLLSLSFFLHSFIRCTYVCPPIFKLRYKHG